MYIILYRIMEFLTGQIIEHLHLLSYRIAEHIKIWCLLHIR
jgi:hypothetical protein